MSNFVLVYRLYDIAEEINLDVSESILSTQSPVSRLKLTRVPTKSIAFTNAPVTVELTTRDIQLANITFKAKTRARLYDLGIISIIIQLELASELSNQEALLLSTAIDHINETYFHESLNSLLPIIKPSLTKPHSPEFDEDLTVYYWTKKMDWDISQILLAEPGPLSPETQRETLANYFSYGNDFAYLTWDTAIVYEPSGSLDVPDLLEFANAQFLKLRSYDHLLDQAIDKMYGMIEEANKGGGYSRLGKYRKIHRKLLALMTDIITLTGKIQNSLRVTEDVFYARIYTAYLRLLKISEWQKSITQKLNAIEHSNELLSEEVVTARSELMEITVVLLIAAEIFISLFTLH